VIYSLKKWQIALILLAVILGGLWFVKVFPDPYHKGEPVNIYTWVYREIDEMLHGEKKVEE